MNRHQKMARFTLILMAIALALSLTTVGILHFGFDFEWRSAIAGLGFMAIMAFSSLGPSLFKNKYQKLPLDERDLLIKKKAMLTAYSAFWGAFILAAYIPWFIIGFEGTININYLPTMVFGGMFLVMTVQSIVTLNEYGWRDKNDE